MAFSFNLAGKARPIASAPADTNEATLFTAAKGNALIGLWVANGTGSPANATVKWGDGSTDYPLIDTFAVPAYGYLIEPEIYIPLGSSYTVKITSGTANALTFTIVILEGQSAVGHSLHQANV